MIRIADDTNEEGRHLIIVADLIVFHAVSMHKGTLNILLCTSKWAATGVDLLLCHVWVFVKSVRKGILLRLGKVIKKH